MPVHIAVDLTPEQARAYRIADNQTATIADWDVDLLQLELADLEALGVDLDVIGFDNDELAALLAPAPTEGHTDGDDVPDAPECARSEAGVAYLLGAHRLVVGDATNEADLDLLMNGAAVDLLLTDPPYGVSYQGGTKDALTIENDALDDEAMIAFLDTSLRNTDRVLRPGGAVYIWHADSNGRLFRQACHGVGWPVRQCLIWVKNALVLGRQDYQWQHEPCLYGWKPGAAHQWHGGRKQTTVLEFDRPQRNGEHPTMKPVALFERLITNSAKPGEIVLDPFGGSGTTAIAAERTGRSARLLELDPRYADVIRKRWAEFVHGAGCDWEALTPHA